MIGVEEGFVRTNCSEIALIAFTYFFSDYRYFGDLSPLGYEDRGVASVSVSVNKYAIAQ